jgi:hypothetical protein
MQRLCKIGKVATYLCGLRLTPRVSNELLNLFIYAVDNDVSTTRFENSCKEFSDSLLYPDSDSLLFEDFDLAVELMSLILTR